MKQVWLIGGYIFLAVALGACEREGNSILPPVEADEVHQHFDDMHVDLTAKASKQFIDLSVSIENPHSEEAPLPLDKNGSFLTVTVKNSTGDEKWVSIDGGERIGIHPLERVTWEQRVPVDGPGPYDISVSTVVPAEGVGSYGLSGRTLIHVEEPQNDKVKERMEFLPADPVVYVYETNAKKKKDRLEKEEFLYTDGDAAQSRVLGKSTSIYRSEKEGFYLLSINDPVGDIPFLEEELTNQKKELLIPFPLKKGDSWKEEGVRHTVLSLRETVKTPYGTFKGCVEVKENKGKTVRYKYYHKDIGLIKVKERSGLRLKTVLSLKDVEPLSNQTQEQRILSTDEMH